MHRSRYADIGSHAFPAELVGNLQRHISPPWVRVIDLSAAIAPLAQSVEHRTFNPLVEGSSPSGRTYPSGQIGIGVISNIPEVPIGVGEVSEVERPRPFEVTDSKTNHADFGLHRSHGRQGGGAMLGVRD